MSSRRSKRKGMVDFKPTLDALRACRSAMVEIQRSYPPRHPLYRSSEHVVADIDSLALQITGDREFFWLPLHST